MAMLLVAAAAVGMGDTVPLELAALPLSSCVAEATGRSVRWAQGGGAAAAAAAAAASLVLLRWVWGGSEDVRSHFLAPVLLLAPAGRSEGFSHDGPSAGLLPAPAPEEEGAGGECDPSPRPALFSMLRAAAGLHVSEDTGAARAAGATARSPAPAAYEAGAGAAADFPASTATATSCDSTDGKSGSAAA
jgi:hypothetical protein